MQKATVLSVDDDQNLQDVVGHYLKSDGYNVIRAANGQQLQERLDSGFPDVILLDLVLPDAEGISLIGKIREKTNAPIIIVSGKSDTTEKIVCMEMGADDYITKPFEMRELAVRIKVALRRTQDQGAPAPQQDSPDSKPGRILFSGWALDRSQYQLFDKDNKSADLTTGEFKLLEALVLSANRALSREQLFDLTRDGKFDVYDRAVDIQIARIRKKLNKDDSPEELIKTIRGVGYMFCGDTQQG